MVNGHFIGWLIGLLVNWLIGFVGQWSMVNGHFIGQWPMVILIRMFKLRIIINDIVILFLSVPSINLFIPFAGKIMTVLKLYDFELPCHELLII